MMRWWLRGGAVLLFAVVMSRTPGDATTVQAGQDVLNANFDQGIGTWQVTAPTNGVAWAADNTPAVAPPSPPNSLNYNNGVNFDAGGIANQGSATSPTFNLTGATAVTLTFQCRWDTEGGNFYDQKWVRMSNNNFVTNILDQQLWQGNPTPAANCPGALVWHQHVFQVIGAAQPNMQVRFFLSTQDGVGNGGAGWAVDNVVVNAQGLAPPPAPPAGPAGPPPGPVAPVIVPDEEIDSDAEEVRNEMCGTFAGPASSGWMLLAACALAMTAGICWKR